MDDLIDREAVLPILAGIARTQGEYDESYDKLMQIPSANRWIPCSERLPEKDTDVIVCCYGSDMILTHDGETIQDAVERTHRECVSVTVGFIGSDGWYGADWFPMMVTPTYWMPLPNKPEVKSNDA